LPSGIRHTNTHTHKNTIFSIITVKNGQKLIPHIHIYRAAQLQNINRKVVITAVRTERKPCPDMMDHEGSMVLNGGGGGGDG